MAFGVMTAVSFSNLTQDFVGYIYEDKNEHLDYGQGLKDVIQNVYATGERFTINEMQVSLPRHSKVETVYLNFVYGPIKTVMDSSRRLLQ